MESMHSIQMDAYNGIERDTHRVYIRAQDYYARVDACLDSFSAASLTPLLWALAVGRMQPPPQWLDRLMRRTALELQRREARG